MDATVPVDDRARALRWLYVLLRPATSRYERAAVEILRDPDVTRKAWRALITTLPRPVRTDLELQVEGRVLTLSGTRRPPTAEGAVYQQLEIEHGRFRRAVDLGVDVDPDAATASYHDGLLRVELPLVQPEKRARTVPIERPEDAET